MSIMTEMTTAQYASELSTDAKTLRKFLRSVTPRDEQPGKGGRWVLKGDKRTIAKDRKRFLAWQKEQADAAAERAAKAAKDAKDAIDADEELDADDAAIDEDSNDSEQETTESE